jgi:L-threonylcarbamoyladenylate synthase
MDTIDTIYCKLQGTEEDEKVFEKAGNIIRGGGLVAFPTETVYGLGGNALDPGASRKIYAAKGRPSDNPLILHISEEKELLPLVMDVPETARKLMKAFWPGPMTLVFRKSPLVPYETTGGLDTAAIRMPSHEAARRLIKAAGVPVAAPSANTSGKPSPTAAEHVLHDMDGRIDMILDGGEVQIGLESTIIDVTGDEVVVLRPGYIGIDRIREVAGGGSIDPAIIGKPDPSLRPKAPGMKYRHYAPKADITIVRAVGRTAATDGIGEADSSEADPGKADSSKADPGKADLSDAEAGRMKPGEVRQDARRPEAAVTDSGTAVQKVAARIRALAEEKASQGYRTRILCAEEHAHMYPSAYVRTVGELAHEETIAHNLYKCLRDFDAEGVDFVFSEAFGDDDLGSAIMNRLTKAAGYHIIDVG